MQTVIKDIPPTAHKKRGVSVMEHIFQLSPNLCDGCKLYDDLVYNYKHDLHLCEDCEEGANLEDNKK